MADLSDVENALGTLIGVTLYPAGAAGEAASPVAGVPVRIEAGWPSPQSLDIAKRAGKAHVSIFPRQGEKKTTRQQPDWQEVSRNAATYALAVSGQTITVTGAAPSPFVAQNVAVLINGAPVLYQPTAGRTANQVATSLAALIPGASAAAGVVTCPPTARIGAARVGVLGQAVRIVRNEAKPFQIVIWAPTPDARVAIARAIDPVLSDTPRLLLADGTIGNLSYTSSTDLDIDQRQGLFRRDLFYTVEFATTRVGTFETIVSSELDLSPTVDGSTPIETRILYS